MDIIYIDTPLLTFLQTFVSSPFVQGQLVIDPIVEASLKGVSCTVMLREVAPVRGLQWILDAYNLSYEQAGPRTIRISFQKSASVSMRPAVSLDDILPR